MCPNRKINAGNGKSTFREGAREGLQYAGSSLTPEKKEVHPGADLPKCCYCGQVGKSAGVR